MQTTGRPDTRRPSLRARGAALLAAALLATLPLPSLARAAEAADAAGEAAAAEVAEPEPDFAERAERVAAYALDIPVVRPLSFVYLGIGFGFFAATSPLTLPTLRAGEAFEYMVRTPYDYAVRRPLGEL